MGNFVFNRGLGRGTQWAENIEANSPTNSKFWLKAWNSSATDATLKDLDDYAAVESDANTAEVTNSGYAAKTLVAADVVVTYDDTNDRVDVDVPDQTWTAVAAGTAWTDLSFGYSTEASPTNAGTLPLSWHDFAITPDGSDITAQIAVFYRAA